MQGIDRQHTVLFSERQNKTPLRDKTANQGEATYSEIDSPSITVPIMSPTNKMFSRWSSWVMTTFLSDQRSFSSNSRMSSNKSPATTSPAAVFSVEGSATAVWAALKAAFSLDSSPSLVSTSC
ncbi:hypothetical protein EB796_015845 [Bugula neritina]|uniref:Uncharacterized protein n=1 Tax=Bugula neritina TaxID=10212 RepID=A0A7J7JKG5_BUGNE|nr:hypothetical protein EB796_015845 [Bugula neritina]